MRERSWSAAALGLLAAGWVVPAPTTAGGSELLESEQGEQIATRPAAPAWSSFDATGSILPPGMSLHHAGATAAVSPRRIEGWSRGAAEASTGIGLRVPLATGRPAWLSELNASAALASGGFAVTWIEGAPFSGAQSVRLQLVGPEGEAILPSGGLELAHGDLSGAVLAPHASSGVFVAFSRLVDGASEIVVHWVDGEGRTRWAADGTFPFGRTRPNQVWSEPALSAGLDGGVFACAMRDRFDFNTQVVCQSLSAEGATLWGRAGLAAGGRRGWRVRPQVVADGTGGVVIVWWNNRDLGDARLDRVLIEAQRFAADGRRLWGAGRVLRRSNLPELPYYYRSLFAVAGDGAGGALVAFVDWVAGGRASFDVMAQRVSPEGRVSWGKGVVVAAGRTTQQVDSLIPAGDGGAIVTVGEYRGDTRISLRTHRLGASGARLWGARGVALSDPTATAADFDSYGFVAGGVLHLAWVHQRAPKSDSFDVYTTRYSLAGQRLGPTGGTLLIAAPPAYFLRGLCSDRQRPVLFALLGETFYEAGSAVDYGVAAALFTPADNDAPIASE